jgi:hypothetical protein
MNDYIAEVIACRIESPEIIINRIAQELEGEPFSDVEA